MFQRGGKNRRKIIVSTNIAETSITIDDVEVVIDSGVVKQMQYDPINKMSKLINVFVSKAMANQRKGRAGRVREGTCIRVYERAFFEKSFPAQMPPEMHRVSLEGLCLQVKVLGLGRPLASDGGSSMDALGSEKEGNPRQFLLKDCLDPPKAEAVESALEMLAEIGACSCTRTNKLKKYNITALGWHLARLPVDVRIGKMLIFGTILRCIDPILRYPHLQH